MTDQPTDEQTKTVAKAITPKTDPNPAKPIVPNSPSAEETEELEALKTSADDLKKQNLLIETKIATEELKKQNIILADNIKKANELQLGGTAPAGQQEPTEAEKLIEGSRALLKGTGYDDQLFPKPAA